MPCLGAAPSLHPSQSMGLPATWRGGRKTDMGQALCPCNFPTTPSCFPYMHSAFLNNVIEKERRKEKRLHRHVAEAVYMLTLTRADMPPLHTPPSLTPYTLPCFLPEEEEEENVPISSNLPLLSSHQAFWHIWGRLLPTPFKPGSQPCGLRKQTETTLHHSSSSHSRHNLHSSHTCLPCKCLPP